MVGYFFFFTKSTTSMCTEDRWMDFAWLQTFTAYITYAQIIHTQQQQCNSVDGVPRNAFLVETYDGLQKKTNETIRFELNIASFLFFLFFFADLISNVYNVFFLLFLPEDILRWLFSPERGPPRHSLAI